MPAAEMGFGPAPPATVPKPPYNLCLRWGRNFTHQFKNEEVVDEALFHMKVAELERFQSLEPNSKMNPQDMTESSWSLDIDIATFHIMLMLADKQGNVTVLSLKKQKKPSKQVPLNMGLKLFGNQGTEAVLKELNQIHMMTTFLPTDPSILLAAEKRGALKSLLFWRKSAPEK